MLELIAPSETIKEARQVLEEDNVLGMWSEKLEDGYSCIKVLLNAERTEYISDILSNRFSNAKGFRITLYAVEATLPQPEVEEYDELRVSEGEKGESSFSGRISREELYSDVTSGSELNKVYLGTVILSSLVAGVGLLRDDVAVIIGAMVIAPLLGPNVSLALAATLADMKLGWQSAKTNIAGLAASLTVAILLGFFFMVDPESEQIASRTLVGPGDIAVALAAGSAGVLAFTRGIPATLIGVMVAVALLPPLVSVGLLLGGGYEWLALRAAILTFTNLICVNLAGIVTFLVQGIRPRGWWEVEQAKKATRAAIAIWFVLLAIFGVLIWLFGKN